ncbi:MAG: hypothetical protein AAGF23_07675, partial [Acidobacteriota bacterium]
MSGPDGADTDARRAEVRRLHRGRPRSRLLRWSAGVALALTAIAWSGDGMGAGEFFSERRAANFERFVGELVPYPLQSSGFEVRGALAFYAELFVEKGFEAAASTLAISIVAITLAA